MRTLTPLGLVGLSLLLAAPAGAAGPDIRCVGPDQATGTSRAVVVGPAALAHTHQVLPLDARGRLVGKDSAAEQVGQVLDNLAAALAAARSGEDRLVKLNVYVARTGLVEDVHKALARRFRGDVKPAVSFVVTPLPHPGALVAADAVAVAEEVEEVRYVTADRLYRAHGGCPVALLPAGPRVYVAGQAEKGNLPEATRRTLASLRATLRHLGLRDPAIVQLKAFLTPMAKADEVQQEVAKSFDTGTVPPLAFVEWRYSGYPIEIELVAAAGKGKEKPAAAVEYLTPPGMEASPLFSRVARANHGKAIYISGLHGPARQSGEAQVLATFGELAELLKETGSDFRHLVKATYYVSTEEASRKLNELRPKFFDPKRPPAASKAMVGGVGREGCGITVDMIAVPAP
jgi:enamine deaminase RidA (YjgF/YER057c/UK114 family)